MADLKDAIGVLLTMLFGAGMLTYLLLPGDPKPPVGLSQDAQAQWVKEMHHAKDELCDIRSICRRNTRARQECATAGDFQNCLQVKLGANDYSQLLYCDDDGAVRDTARRNLGIARTPNEVECMIRPLVKLVH